MKRNLITLLVSFSILSTPLFAKEKITLTTIPAGGTLTVIGANDVADGPDGWVWVWTPPKGQKCETFTVKAHWISGAEASRQVTVCAGKKNQVFFINRPGDIPGFQQDWDYGVQILSERRQQTQQAQRPSLGQTLAQGLAEGLSKDAEQRAKQPYHLVQQEMDPPHQLIYCYYRDDNNEALVQQQPIQKGCPSRTSK